MAFPVAQSVKKPPTMQDTQVTRVWSLGWEESLEEGMAMHASILAWRNPWMEEPDGLQSMGLQRVGHNLSDWTCIYTHTPVLLPGKSHGWRSLVGCSLWGRWELGTTERLHFHFSFSCIGEGNGNPLQCSCLENSRDGGAWWAAVYGVAQSRTLLKRLSSSSIRIRACVCVCVCVCVCMVICLHSSWLINRIIFKEVICQGRQAQC